VDPELVLALVYAVHGTLINASTILDADTWLRDDVGHLIPPELS
jgi:hypothetical protein